MPTALDHPPSVELLKSLTPGSLKQNLAKALRLWVILRTIYGDEADIRLQHDEFTYNQLRLRMIEYLQETVNIYK
jgi:hypothetical protein